MSLANLLKIGRLKAHTPTAAEVGRLLAAARRNIEDANAETISDETRFDAAYKAIMQLALAAMMANGYRPSTSEAGHHQTLLQSLPLTVGLPNEQSVVIDALRRKRNAADYLGDGVEPDALAECRRQAGLLRDRVIDWLEREHPALLED